jgi:hypothetical protein
MIGLKAGDSKTQPRSLPFGSCQCRTRFVTEPKMSTTEKLKALFAEYGKVALVTFAVLAVLTFVGLFIAVSSQGPAVASFLARFGFDQSALAGQASALGIAYVLYKFTTPIRAAIVLLLTPVIAKLCDQVRAKAQR